MLRSKHIHAAENQGIGVTLEMCSHAPSVASKRYHPLLYALAALSVTHLLHEHDTYMRVYSFVVTSKPCWAFN